MAVGAWLRIGFGVAVWAVVIACVPQPARPRDVALTGINVFVTDRGEMTLPIVGTTNPQALSLIGPEVLTVTAVVNPDGSMTLPLVTGGPYYLRFGLDYLFTTRDTIDVGSAILGRPDRRAAGANTRLTYALDGLQAWQDTDLTETWSTGAGLDDYAPEVRPSTANPPVAGATQLAMTAEVSEAALPTLVEAGKGDRAIVIHSTTRTVPGSTVGYRASQEVFETEALTMTSGGVRTLSGVFRDLSQESLSFAWELSAFDALSSEVSGFPFGAFHRFEVLAQPNGRSQGRFVVGATLLECIDVQSNGTARFSARYDFGNPFPASYPLLAQASVDHPVVVVTAPGASQSGVFFGQVSITVPMESLRSSSAAPLVTPPRNLRVAGQDATFGIALDTDTPTLSWELPRLGTPSYYAVTVVRAVASGQGTRFERTGTVFTTERRVRLPPGLLQPGAQQLIRVRAIASTIDIEQTPFRASLTGAHADSVTGLIESR